jgi:hypothetical protein
MASPGPSPAESIVLFGVLVAIVAFFIHAPILKPWFGFRKPKGHPGRWFE